MPSIGGASTTPWGELARGETAGPVDRSYWVIEDRLAGGAYPFHSNPSKGVAILGRIQRSGIDTFINLTRYRDGSSTDAHLVSYPLMSATAFGSVTIRSPISTCPPPTR